MTNSNVFFLKVLRKIFVLFDKLNKYYWDEYDKTIPKYTLNEKHYKNLKPILNRDRLLEVLRKYGVVAEIGVYRGEFSKKILYISKPRKLHLIDSWGSKRYHGGLYERIKAKFKVEIAKGTVEINRGLSTEICDNFKDNYFDWIYIDSAHSYDVTKLELNKYSKKVKQDGVIAGHDFVIGNWNDRIRYGVIDAVYEFCVKHNWELIYLTVDYTEPISYAIRRI